MKLKLEFFFTKIAQESVQYWRNIIDITDTKADPDTIVLRVLESDLHEKPKILKEEYIIHSTSWRYESEGSIVLTYLVYSDHLDFGENKFSEIPLNKLSISRSASHKKPRPEIITEINVIAHALRHLAFLVDNNDHNRYKKCLSTKTLNSLKQLGIALAGKF